MIALFVCVWFIACTDVLQMSINRIPLRKRDKTALLLTCVTRMAHTNLPTNPLWVREVPAFPLQPPTQFPHERRLCRPLFYSLPSCIRPGHEKGELEMPKRNSIYKHFSWQKQWYSLRLKHYELMWCEVFKRCWIYSGMTVQLPTNCTH